jgi:hypothetical protein
MKNPPIAHNSIGGNEAGGAVPFVRLRKFYLRLAITREEHTRARLGCPDQGAVNTASSFLAKGRHWVHFHRPPRGDITGRKRHSCEHKGDTNKR